MASEQILLDPTGESTGTQLDITDSTLGYFLISHDYNDPDIDVVQAGSIDTEGSVPAAGKHQPRTITTVVRCVQPPGGSPSIGTIVSNLQRKIGKLFREGGTYRRVLPSGDTMTYDVLPFSARITVPADKRWVARQAADVTMTFTCKPYGRGASVSATLSASTATAKAPHVFTFSGVKGDVPALGTLAITNVVAAKSVLVWGVRSRYYDASAPLFYEAESLTAGSATATAGPASASGGGGNTVMRHLDVGTGGVTSFSFGTTGVPHIGTYRVFTRVQASGANTGIVSLRVNYYPQISGPYIRGTWVPIVSAAGAAVQGSWVIVDLGLVSIPKAKLGTQAWSADFAAKSTVATDDIDWDWVALIPVDEGSGELKVASGAATIPIPLAGGVTVTSDTAQIRNGSAYWSAAYQGDYLLIPPAGAEARTVEMIAFLAGPITTGSGNVTDTVIDAANLDATTAAVTYIPRYLSVPAP